MRILAASVSALVLVGLLGACSAQDDSTGESTDFAKPGGSLCGNGRIDSGEQCDGRDLGGETCDSVTMGDAPEGRLACTKRCKFNTRGCSGGGTGGSGR